jgi:hypothetical protein
MTIADQLAQAARAVVERWDSPLWKDLPHTAESINALRAALAAYDAAPDDDAKDAARYRWLRTESAKKHDFYSNEAQWMVSKQFGGMGHNFFGDKIDAAIDAARSKP